jgi:hypothetical protein
MSCQKRIIRIEQRRGRMDKGLGWGRGDTMNNLTSGTMTELGIKRPLPRKLIFHPPAMAAPFIECLEPFSILTVYFIRRVEFPFVLFAFDILRIMSV